MGGGSKPSSSLPHTHGGMPTTYPFSCIGSLPDVLLPYWAVLRHSSSPVSSFQSSPCESRKTHSRQDTRHTLQQRVGVPADLRAYRYACWCVAVERRVDELIPATKPLDIPHHCTGCLGRNEVAAFEHRLDRVCTVFLRRAWVKAVSRRLRDVVLVVCRLSRPPDPERIALVGVLLEVEAILPAFTFEQVVREERQASTDSLRLCTLNRQHGTTSSKTAGATYIWKVSVFGLTGWSLSSRLTCMCTSTHHTHSDRVSGSSSGCG